MSRRIAANRSVRRRRPGRRRADRAVHAYEMVFWNDLADG